VAGNIANASPASDLAPILLVHDAELELASARGVRRVALESFWTGYKTDVLEPDELIVGVFLPRPGFETNCHYFRKVAPRASNSIAIVNFAARGTRDETGRWSDLKLAFGCMGPFPMRARAAEKVLAGRWFEGDCRAEVLAILERELRPVSDHRASAEYRSQAGLNLAAAFLSGSIGETIQDKNIQL
jgi:CO/xanthine dehydrogenase FAD-binding subunit